MDEVRSFVRLDLPS